MPTNPVLYQVIKAVQSALLHLKAKQIFDHRDRRGLVILKDAPFLHVPFGQRWYSPTMAEE